MGSAWRTWFWYRPARSPSPPAARSGARSASSCTGRTSSSGWTRSEALQQRLLPVAVRRVMRRGACAEQRQRVADIVLGRWFAVAVAVLLAIGMTIPGGAQGDRPLRGNLLPEQ